MPSTVTTSPTQDGSTRLGKLRDGMQRALAGQRQADQALADRLEARWDGLVTTVDPLRALRAEMDAALAARRAEDQALVARLEARWPAIRDEHLAEAARYDVLLAKLPPDDPALLPVHLLGATNQVRDERRHTSLMCLLMSPSAAGPVAVDMLRAFANLAGATDVPDASLPEAAVWEPQWVRTDGKSRYPDIVIEIPAAERTTWLVVENKVGHYDTEGQLDDYATLADANLQGDVHLVFLTPDGHAPGMAETSADRWRRVSYRQLAVAWRRVLAQRQGADAWSWMLRLYLGSIVQGVLGIKLGPGLSVLEKAALLDYLEAATGESR